MYTTLHGVYSSRFGATVLYGHRGPVQGPRTSDPQGSQSFDVNSGCTPRCICIAVFLVLIIILCRISGSLFISAICPAEGE